MNEEPEQSVTVDAVSAVDIANAVKIIDASAQRGAFQGNELTTVGSCRDRLEGYIAHLRPPQEQPEEPQEPEQE